MAKSESGSSIMYLVAITKIAEAAFLLLAAFGAHKLLHGGDTEKTVVHWVSAVRVDPENKFVHALLNKTTGLTPRKMEEISLGTMLYGILFAIEGTGLFMRKRWAEWVTVISTSGFLPLEIYEVYERVHMGRVIVLLINALIVVYLIVRLSGQRKTR